MTNNKTTASDHCPKWEKCKAPICPLDPDWEKRKMMPDESICFYQSEAMKADAKANFEMRGAGELFDLVSGPIPAMSAKWARIRLGLARAKPTGSRMTTIPPRLKGSCN